MTKKAQVVMLPTKISRLHLLVANPPDSRPIWTKFKWMVNPIGNHKHTAEYDPQHLYFISNDEIDEGDLIKESGKSIVRCKKILGDDLIWISLDGKSSACDATFEFRKIIASTDPTLGLPAIPEEWIRDVYVPSNGSIKEVDLEMEGYYYEGIGELTGPLAEYKLKLIKNEVCIVESKWDKLNKRFDKALSEKFEKIEELKAELIDESLEKEWKEFEDLPRKTYSLRDLINRCKDKELKGAVHQGMRCTGCGQTFMDSTLHSCNRKLEKSIDKELGDASELYVASKSQRISNTQTYNIVQDAFKAGVEWQKEKFNEILEEAMMFAWQLGHKNVNWPNKRMIEEFYEQKNTNQY